jgi:nitrate/nitrite-specific signal transduction histidine kinase
MAPMTIMAGRPIPRVPPARAAPNCARNFRDSTSQLLAVLQLQLHQLSPIDHPDAESLIDECQQAIREIREQICALNIG